MTTWAPSAAISPAVTSPMPLPAPVTIATCPSRTPIRPSDTPSLLNASHSHLYARLARRGPQPRDVLRLLLPFVWSPRTAGPQPRDVLRLLLPGPHRLLEVVHAGGAAVHHHLAKLIEHRGGRRVDQRAEQRQLDHRPVTLGDRYQDRHLGPVQVLERHAIHAGDLVGVERGLGRALAPQDDRRDHEPRARRVVVEPAQDRVGADRE